MKKAILVGIDMKSDNYDINYSLNELSSLAIECDIKEVFRLTQKLEQKDKLTYLKKGKIEELLVEIQIHEAEICIFNDELTPLMLKTLNDLLPCQIIDRTLLILDIFLHHAKTNEAKLEVKLAHLKYLYPRLQSLRDGFDRQGGIGSKGPGETQLELDRRHIQNEIIKIERELQNCEKRRLIQIDNRKKTDIKTVALVGYTNAGKSTTMNSLIEYTNKDENKKVYAKNQLFATLETSTRRIDYNNYSFLLTDTIGFVSKLPTTLIHSFKETLFEATKADLIIHVLDISSKYAFYEFQITMQVLASLNVDTSKMLVLLNKRDLLKDQLPPIMQYNYLAYSNNILEDREKLLNYIINFLNKDSYKLTILIPYEDGKTLNYVLDNTNVTSQIYTEKGILISLNCTQKYYNKLSIYEVTDTFYSN